MTHKTSLMLSLEWLSLVLIGSCIIQDLILKAVRAWNSHMLGFLAYSAALRDHSWRPSATSIHCDLWAPDRPWAMKSQSKTPCNVHFPCWKHWWIRHTSLTQEVDWLGPGCFSACLPCNKTVFRGLGNEFGESQVLSRELILPLGELGCLYKRKVIFLVLERSGRAGDSSGLAGDFRGPEC